MDRTRSAWAVGLLASALCASESPAPRVGGAGWMQFGMIAASTDTAGGKRLAGRSMIVSGSQFQVRYDAAPNLRIEAGLGAVAGHQLAVNEEASGGYAPVNVGPYVAEADFTLSLRDAGDSRVWLRGGFFPYDYVPDAQNLGLYLLRGPLYPGYLISGFETKHVLPVANMLGFQLHHQAGPFEHDLLFNIESDFYPYYDISPAYVASYRAGAVMRIGAGAEFYHFIAVDPALTRDEKIFYVDTAAHDTTVIPFKGVKLMADFTFDPKALLGAFEALGAEDLKLYGEAALLGLDDGKAYRALYGSYAHRMPIMGGCNLPAFKLLDRLSLEVEWYGATFKDDLKRFNHTSANQPVPFPIVDGEKYRKDDIKWSLYGSRVIAGHVKLSFQAASDHFRPGIFNGYGDNNPPGSEAVFFSPREWYWETKAAYYF